PDHVPAPSYFHHRSLHDALPISHRGRALPERPVTMIDVAATDEVGPGATMRIEVGEFEICIARDSDGTIHAVDDVCTHGEVSLRSEEHTSELQSRFDLVCRLLLE